MLKYTAATNDKKNRATTQYTGATLDGTGTMTNNGNGLFRSDLNNPIIKTQYTGATLDGKGTITNPINGPFQNQITIDNTNAGAGAYASPSGLKYTVSYSDLDTSNGGGGNGGNGGGGTTVANTAVNANPYANLYSIYENQLNAQKAALEQQRQARLGALQSNYANAKNQLSGAFDSGENQINTDADKALRESYVNMMLNQKRLNQQLESQGINGGAMESSLARAYNDYGNSRNNIEQGRLDNISQLLREYQNSLGDVENNYQNNLANLDADYSGNIADAVSNYYQTIANLQAQNAASSLKNALGKSSSSSTKSGDTVDADTKAIVNVLKNFKSNPSSALTYLNNRGIVGADAEDLLWQAGIDPTLLNLLNEPVTEATANATLGSNALGGLTQSAKNNIINTLKRVASLSRGTGDAYANAAAQMDQFARQYNLTQEEASALLAAAGF